MKSDTCFSKTSSLPLSQYVDKDAAQEDADYANVRYGNDMVPYICCKCGWWHLSPKSRETPSYKCAHCTGGDGVYKDSYRTKHEAELRADIIYKEQGICLRVYKCEYGSGWHLTKTRY